MEEQIFTHIGTGVTGVFVKRYKVTGAGYSIMVRCNNGRLFYAPEDEWIKTKDSMKNPSFGGIA